MHKVVPALVAVPIAARPLVDGHAVALVLEDDEVLVVNKGYTVDRAAVDGLEDDLRVVGALREGARAPRVRLHHEAVARDARAVCAPDAIQLVNVEEAQLQRLAIFVKVELQVAGDSRVLHHRVLLLVDRRPHLIHKRPIFAVFH